MPSKRILLLYISPDSGHHRASLAIEKAIRSLAPDSSVLNVNALHYMNPGLERMIKKSYFGLIRTRPEVWEYLYDNPQIVKSTQRLRQIIHRFHSPKCQSLLNDFRPDAVVCTQAFPCGIVADLKKDQNLSLPLIGVMTDYFPHSYWLYEQVNFYVVPSEQAKMQLFRNGILKDKILTYGIPIDPKFGTNGKREGVFLRYGLHPECPLLLVMGGSQGFGPLWKVVKALDRLEIAVQVVVLCGKNASLYQKLKRQEKRFQKKMLVFGFMEDIDALMEAATLLVTKPGGVTTAEALAKGLPLVLLNPVRGQETSNANFLVREGVAVKAEDEGEASILIQELLRSPTKLSDMRRCALQHQKPQSAIEVARFLLSLSP